MNNPYRFVADLPDLIGPEDYPEDPEGRRVRLRLRVVDGRIEILGDAARAATLEKLLETLDAGVIEQMLCG